MVDSAGGHVAVTRRLWDERMSAWFERYARSRWAAAGPYWGMWCIASPGCQSCGLAWLTWRRWSWPAAAGMSRRGWPAAARLVRVDVSARQLAVAQRLQGEFGLRFPLVQADAERVPLGAGCADLVISEYGASVWCDPFRWVPEAARLRPGGRLVFMAQSMLARLCIPVQGLATGRLVRELFGLHRIVQRGTSGREYRLFTLPHGEWIRLLGRCGLMVEDMIEVEVPPGAWESPHPCDFALVAILGLLGLRIFEATGADIADLGEEHGHRVLHVCGKGTKIVLLPLPPAVGRAIDQAIGSCARGPILLNSRGARMDRHAATRRLRHLAGIAGVRITRPHPPMLRHTYDTTMLDAGVDLRDVQIAARHADPRTTMRYDRARKNLDRHPNYILAAYMASGDNNNRGSPTSRSGILLDELPCRCRASSCSPSIA